MSERKVLNKYFPPNFDPSKIPRRKKPLDVKDKRHKVRLMAPFSMQCETCREFIYKGKKFNAIKETVKGEAYLTIKIFRFYIRCPKCHAEITFKTDPANLDYVAERGAVRNYDPRRDEVAVNKIQSEVKEEEEEMDPLKALENRTRESRREMQIMDALEEVRTRNARVERVDVDGLLDKLVREGVGVGGELASVGDEEDELEREAREAFAGVDPAAGGSAGGALSKLRMAAIWSDDDDDGNEDEDAAAPDASNGDLDDDDGHAPPQDEEDLDALLLQYRFASSSASASTAASSSSSSSSAKLKLKPKKRSHAETSSSAEDALDSLVSAGAGRGNEWASLAKRVKTNLAAAKPNLGAVKPVVVVKQQALPAPPPKPTPTTGLLGLAYGDDDDDDSE